MNTLENTNSTPKCVKCGKELQDFEKICYEDMCHCCYKILINSYEA